MSDGNAAHILAAIDSFGTALRAEMVTLRSDIMARIDSLQDRLTTEQEGGIVTPGAAERAERIAKSTRTDMKAPSRSCATASPSGRLRLTQTQRLLRLK